MAYDIVPKFYKLLHTLILTGNHTTWEKECIQWIELYSGFDCSPYPHCLWQWWRKVTDASYWGRLQFDTTSHHRCINSQTVLFILKATHSYVLLVVMHCTIHDIMYDVILMQESSAKVFLLWQMCKCIVHSVLYTCSAISYQVFIKFSSVFKKWTPHAS